MQQRQEDGNPDIYTVTIIKNMGSPISFTLKRWTLLVILSTLSIIFITFTYLSVEFILSKSQEIKMMRELVFVKKNLQQIIKKLTNKDKELFFADLGNPTHNREELKSALTSQPVFDTKGIWSSYKLEDNSKNQSIDSWADINSFKSSIRGDYLTIHFKVVNATKPLKNIGGYVFITLLNEDTTIPSYRPATRGELGDNGYPVNYKSGIAFYIKKRARSGSKRIGKKIKLNSAEEYYTSVIVFIYSYKGALITKKSFLISKEIFFGNIRRQLRFVMVTNHLIND